MKILSVALVVLAGNFFMLPKTFAQTKIMPEMRRCSLPTDFVTCAPYGMEGGFGPDGTIFWFHCKSADPSQDIGTYRAGIGRGVDSSAFQNAKIVLLLEDSSQSISVADLKPKDSKRHYGVETYSSPKYGTLFQKSSYETYEQFEKEKSDFYLRKIEAVKKLPLAFDGISEKTIDQVTNKSFEEHRIKDFWIQFDISSSILTGCKQEDTIF